MPECNTLISLCAGQTIPQMLRLVPENGAKNFPNETITNVKIPKIHKSPKIRKNPEKTWSYDERKREIEQEGYVHGISVPNHKSPISVDEQELWLMNDKGNLRCWLRQEAVWASSMERRAGYKGYSSI